MSLTKRIAAVVVPLGLVVGGVAYGVSRHESGDDKTLGRVHHEGRRADRRPHRRAGAQRQPDRGDRRPPRACRPTRRRSAWPTALQESKLYNLHGGDRDSLGLFQQRHSQGWGTPQQILDPVHATNAFYDALEQVPG